MASVLGLQPGQMVGVRLDPVGQLEEKTAAFVGCEARPGRRGGAGGVDSPIHVLGPGLGH